MLKKIASGPYLVWILLFILIPILMIAFFGMVRIDPETGNYFFTSDNFKRVFEGVYLSVWTRSIFIALKATFICLVLGYPMAMILSRMDVKYRTIAVMLFVVPMWMNFLLRTYAWMTILGKNGVLNKILTFFGLPQMTFLYSEGAVLLGMVYNFLPFMVLPIYTVLSKMDNGLIEAAEDLGANKFNSFRKVILPLSIPGIVSGISMVFMPAVSTFVISNLLYGGQYMLIGNLIEQQFLVVNDWHFGSAISIILMIIILLTMAIMNHLSGNDPEDGGANLW
ncbi:spermidine/putrescine transport system permease protein [Fusibacter tunisiensis]|uniref:Spermidine/putrescine transport system permease protein n=1 Tax=Fusibacter tunisiensis TaxID=1008308 RepID=A0ABS2MS94_9FIRM|nr:spermidine/putrescine transport system permease protein [Fusibacter tunisiensis]